MLHLYVVVLRITKDLGITLSYTLKRPFACSGYTFNRCANAYTIVRDRETIKGFQLKYI